MDEAWLRHTAPRDDTRLLRGKAGGKPSSLVKPAHAANALAEAERRADKRYTCDFAARIASADRLISTAGRIVNISQKGARVEVMFPRGGPTILMLHNLVNEDIYECQVRWRTDAFIGVRFIDILGPSRRRQYFADDDVRLIKSNHQFIQLAKPTTEFVVPEPPPPRFAISPPLWLTALHPPLSPTKTGFRSWRSTTTPPPP